MVKVQGHDISLNMKAVKQTAKKMVRAGVCDVRGATSLSWTVMRTIRNVHDLPENVHDLPEYVHDLPESTRTRPAMVNQLRPVDLQFLLLSQFLLKVFHFSPSFVLRCWSHQQSKAPVLCSTCGALLGDDDNLLIKRQAKHSKLLPIRLSFFLSSCRSCSFSIFSNDNVQFCLSKLNILWLKQGILNCFYTPGSVAFVVEQLQFFFFFFFFLALWLFIRLRCRWQISLDEIFFSLQTIFFSRKCLLSARLITLITSVADVCVCGVCVTMTKRARRIESTTSDTTGSSSK